MSSGRRERRRWSVVNIAIIIIIIIIIILIIIRSSSSLMSLPSSPWPATLASWHARGGEEEGEGEREVLVKFSPISDARWKRPFPDVGVRIWRRENLPSVDPLGELVAFQGPPKLTALDISPLHIPRGETFHHHQGFCKATLLAAPR